MKNKTYLLPIILAVLLGAAASARADALAYAQVIKERDKVLSAILAQREARITSGVADEEAVLSARLALWSFRRDTATTREEKIKQQHLIVGALQTKLEEKQARRKIGIGGPEEELLAQDRVLEAQQVLERLRMDQGR